MPVMLIVLFGYGLSLDVKNVPVALVMEDPSRRRHGSRIGFQALALFRRHAGQDHGRGRKAAARQASQRHRPHPARFRPPASNSAMRRCRSWSTARTPTRRASLSAMPGRRRHLACPARPRGDARSSRAGRRREPALVQRSQREPLFPRPGTDRAGDDADRRAPDLAGHGARMGARNASRRCSSRPSAPAKFCSGKIVPYFVLGMIGLALCILGSKVPVRSSAARLDPVLVVRVDALPAGGARHRPA